MYYVTTAGR